MTNGELADWLFEWTFKNRRQYLATHNIHRYPAVFVPELASKIIETFSNEGDVILDIFSGSGTTLVESMLLGRKAIGIELNPLALLITKVKTTPIRGDVLELAKAKFLDDFSTTIAPKMFFEKIDFWFHEVTIQSLSDAHQLIMNIGHSDVRDLFVISLSEIIRQVSYCNHSGFKMHKDKAKSETHFFDKEGLLKLFLPVLERNIKLVKGLFEALGSRNCFEKPMIIKGDSTTYQSQIKSNSVDLIITSPPYGDSSTTVAYGQFSRLSSELLGLETLTGIPVAQLDNDLLGGKTSHINSDTYVSHSITLQNIIELFNLRAHAELEPKARKRHLNRLKDVISFYDDLEKCIINASNYLRKDKYFVLVTASRIVHGIKLHTDSIIAELAHHSGFKLKNIYYRDIHNKRMPSRVSATNIKGQTSPTMTEESIIVLQKIS